MAQKATILAHVDAGRMVSQIELPDLSENTIGYFIGYLETVCAVSALLLGVNPFDQPGVEAYKRNLFAIMGRPGFEDKQAELLDRI